MQTTTFEYILTATDDIGQRASTPYYVEIIREDPYNNETNFMIGAIAILSFALLIMLIAMIKLLRLVS